MANEKTAKGFSAVASLDRAMTNTQMLSNAKEWFQHTFSPLNSPSSLIFHPLRLPLSLYYLGLALETEL